MKLPVTALKHPEKPPRNGRGNRAETSGETALNCQVTALTCMIIHLFFQKANSVYGAGIH